MLKRTPFYDFHLATHARMVEYAGWEMPLLYTGIVEEHEQTRRSGSIFDVSHMGRIYFTGADVVAFLQRILTRNVGDQAVGQSRYSLVCNAAGMTLDDVIVSRDNKNWIMVCNAANRAKILAHLMEVRQSGDFDLDISDQTEATAMVALQGPQVMQRLGSIIPTDLKRYHFANASYMGLVKFLVFRSGYTGEDGVEVIVSAKIAGMALKLLSGKFENVDATIKPAGLGARDTLRLEAGMPLYGHELSEETDPLSASLGWAVDLKKDFIGAEALRALAAKGPARKLVGLELEGRRIARQGAALLNGAATVGTVTSGTFSPTLQKSIAMALVDAHLTTAGTQLSADFKGSTVRATVVKLPFYKRT